MRAASTTRDTRSPGDAKALLRTGAQLRQSLAMLDAGPRQLREHVRAAFHELRERMVRRELADIPVTRIKDVTGGGVRINLLQRGGYTTVAHVHAASAARLQDIPGVGSTTANQAIAAARQIADAIRTSLHFRVDLDPANPSSTALISALYRWDSLTAIAARQRQPSAQLAAELDTALAAAAPTMSRMRMFFRRSSHRLAACTALHRVAQLIDWSHTSGFGADLERAGEFLSRSTNVADAAWKDFEKRSVEYYGRLGEVVDIALNVEAAEGFLPAEIISKVNEQTLDEAFRRVSLRGYQSFGARFALVQRRVIIGDEMGLGKTIQAIAVMAHLRSLDHRHFLVACPASVIVNWTREIAARSALRPYRLHGQDRRTNLSAWIRNGGVAVTTIDSLHHLRVSAHVGISLFVVDEAHYAKNPRARRSQSVRAWTDVVERVVFLTGTPMENRVEEFKNLVDYLQPDLLPSVNGHHGAAGPAVFRRTVAPVYLRRNQEDVLTELPDLTKVDEWVEFGTLDRGAYRDAVLEGNFMAMRRAAYLPGDVARSAKLARLVELVEECAANGRKVVVFSYFRDVLDIVAHALGPARFGPLTGSTPATARQALIDRFAAVEGHAVLVSQIQAGGVGVNMQAASVAILCEPQLKPTTEDQAVARLHRMGQVRTVQLHRLLATNSADERLLELLDIKARLFDDYARRSDLAEAAPDAIDISDVELSRKIVELEQERIASEALAAHAGDDPAQAVKHRADETLPQ